MIPNYSAITPDGLVTSSQIAGDPGAVNHRFAVRLAFKEDEGDPRTQNREDADTAPKLGLPTVEERPVIPEPLDPSRPGDDENNPPPASECRRDPPPVQDPPPTGERREIIEYSPPLG